MNPIPPYLSSEYTPRELAHLCRLLGEGGVFTFERFATGLFPAVGPGSPTERTSGYRSVWVRDNVHIAYAHLVAGDRAVAVQNALALAAFFGNQRHRFAKIIENPQHAAVPMNRPHIRFNGETGEEIAQKWPHAQNDALGYFLWFFCTLVREGAIEPTARHRALLADFARYFKAIRYWEDEESGHWEEQRKIAASSIGAVNAGLRRYRELLTQPQMVADKGPGVVEVDEMLATGIKAMNEILPAECIQPAPQKQRRYDAALLFLIDPLDIVDTNQAAQIVADVTSTLQGEYGIARYPGDAYWGPDYRRIPEEKRTIDLSDDIIERSAFAVEGQEAKWCLFDPILSVIHGRRYLISRDKAHLSRQTEYLNRSLRQLVESTEIKGRLLLPEAYFMENGKYVPNDHLPLQWAEANLMRAIEAMRVSLGS